MLWSLRSYVVDVVKKFTDVLLLPYILANLNISPLCAFPTTPLYARPTTHFVSKEEGSFFLPISQRRQEFREDHRSKSSYSILYFLCKWCDGENYGPQCCALLTFNISPLNAFKPDWQLVLYLTMKLVYWTFLAEVYGRRTSTRISLNCSAFWTAGCHWRAFWR